MTSPKNNKNHIDRSNLFQLAQLIPAETSTLAKSPTYINGILGRTYAVSAKGAYFTDFEGRVWLDCDMALGSIVWGHAHPTLVAAARRQATRGFSFSVPSIIEGELAERLIQRLRKFDQIQFAKNGSDVTTAAIRLARAVTGRQHVILGRYHGWHDWSAIHHYSNSSNLGVLDEAKQKSIWVTHEDAKHIISALDSGINPAAIILCPEHWNIDDLHEVRRIASRQGIILIFDEVKSGMRFGPRGVFDAKGVIPDLLCIGKGLANGAPLSALLGPRELMCQLPEVRFSGTFATETLSMAIALAAEKMLQEQTHWPPWQNNAIEIMKSISSTIESLGLSAELAVHGYPGSFFIADLNGVMPLSLRNQLIETLAHGNIFSRGYFVPSIAHGHKEMSNILELVQMALTDWSVRNGVSSSKKSYFHPCSSGEV